MQELNEELHYVTLPECLCCGNRDLEVTLDLKAQPPANSYHRGRHLQSIPLVLHTCNRCWHSQLSVSADPEALFSEYLYVSGTSATLLAYFEDFADRVTARHSPGRILDIASNDGSLLRCFKSRGWYCVGFDPAANLAEKAREYADEVIVGFWGKGSAGQFDERFDVIDAQNVVAHVPDPIAFLKECRNAIKPGGLIYVQTSQCEMFVRNEFDTIYHEHLSYFSARSLAHAAHAASLYVVQAGKVPVHGTSYLFALSSTPCDESELERMIQVEEAEGRYSPELYDVFARRATEIARALRSTIAKLRGRGFRIVGYGAAAKGNTLLNFGDIDLDYIVDDNPLKWGLMTPGRNIQIKASADLADENRPVALFVLAWNFLDEIKRRVAVLRDVGSDVFLTSFPEVSVVDAEGVRIKD